MHSALRICSRIVRRCPQRMFFSIDTKGSYFGFECAQYAHREYDLNLLEKSIRYGCQTIVEKSAAYDSIRTYELLVDVAAAEDVEINDFFLVHLLGDKSVEDAISTKREIADIQNVLKKRSLDVVSVSLPSTQSLHKTYVAKGGDDYKNLTIEALFATIVNSFLTEQFLELSETCNESTRLGVDISTAWLASASDDDISVLLAAFDQFNEKCNGSSSSVRNIKCVAVASNSFTYQHLSRIHSWAASNGVQVVATEVLKGHVSRPGLLSVEGGRLKLTPSKAGDAPKDAPPSNDPGVLTVNAVNDFNRAMNACLHAEKEYIRRFGDTADAVPSHTVCWGHNLSQAQHTILYPEEWDFLYAQQVLPMLTDATDSLKQKSEKEKDWSMLYHPLSKKLFADFNTVLEKRRTHLCHDVHNAIAEHGSREGAEEGEDDLEAEMEDWTSYRKLPQFLATISATHGSHKVAVASAVVLATRWLESKDALTSSIMGEVSEANTAKVHEAVGAVLAAYNTPANST